MVLALTSQNRDHRTVRVARYLLGMCNFYRRFIKDYSKISRPLHRLTRKEVTFEWNLAREQAFKELKRRLLTTLVSIQLSGLSMSGVQS